jgi:hypothetical protein
MKGSYTRMYHLLLNLLINEIQQRMSNLVLVDNENDKDEDENEFSTLY